MEKLKAWLKGAVASWTIWFNAVGIPILYWLADNVEVWQEVAGEYTNEIIIIVNVLLRIKTTSSLQKKGQSHA